MHVLMLLHEYNHSLLYYYTGSIRLYGEAISVCPDSFRDQITVMYNNKAAAYEKLSMWKHVVEDACNGLSHDPLYVKLLTRVRYCIYIYICHDDFHYILGLIL